MNDRFGNQRNRQGEFGRHAASREPQYSSDYDETYGSEWERGRTDQPGGGYRPEPGGGYRPEPGGGYRPEPGGGYRPEPGGGYGLGRERGFGGGRDQGYRGPDLASPGTDLRARSGGGFAGRGPKGYTRTDERIHEEVCDRLSRDDDVDASEIEVRVQNGEVTLEGTVQTRSMKHQAEDLAEEVSGVTDVHNRLRVIKGLMNELKDKVTGKEREAHYAQSGTKDSPASGSAHRVGTNGTL